MTKTEDPRLGLPSASSALEDSLCPARWRAQKEWDEMCGGDTPEETAESQNEDPRYIDSDIEAGRRIHKLYAREECPDATDREIERVEHAWEIDKSMKEKWLSTFPDQPDAQLIELRETRWWLLGNEGQKIYSGQTDAVWVRGEFGGEADILVADLKGLWGYHDSAELNMQIRRYIALVVVNIEDFGFSGVSSASAYLNQPAVTRNPLMAVYGKEDIDLALRDMLVDVAAMHSPKARRVAGAVQCKNCRAKLICEEHLSAEVALPVVPPVKTPMSELPTPAALESKVLSLSNDKLAQLLPWCAVMEKLSEVAEHEAKRRLRKDENAFGGTYYLSPNPPRRAVDDMTTLWNRLSNEVGVKEEEFVAMCKTTIAAVETIVRKKTGLRGKNLEQKVDALLDKVAVLNPVASTLKRKQ